MMKRLTGSVEHHEDRPLLLLQQLPEVLEEWKREREDDYVALLHKLKKKHH